MGELGAPLFAKLSVSMKTQLRMKTIENQAAQARPGRSADIPVRCHGGPATEPPTLVDVKEFVARAASVKEDTKR